MQHWSIGRKYASVFAFIMVIFLASFIYLSTVLTDLQKAINLAEEKSDYAIMISEMGSSFRQKYIIITDYITEPKPELLAAYEKEAEQFSASSKKLQTYVKSEEAKTLLTAIMNIDQHMDKVWEEDILKTVSEFQQNFEQVDIDRKSVV